MAPAVYMSIATLILTVALLIVIKAQKSWPNDNRIGKE